MQPVQPGSTHGITKLHVRSHVPFGHAPHHVEHVISHVERRVTSGIGRRPSRRDSNPKRKLAGHPRCKPPSRRPKHTENSQSCCTKKTHQWRCRYEAYSSRSPHADCSLFGWRPPLCERKNKKAVFVNLGKFCRSPEPRSRSRAKHALDREGESRKT